MIALLHVRGECCIAKREKRKTSGQKSHASIIDRNSVESLNTQSVKISKVYASDSAVGLSPSWVRTDKTHREYDASLLATVIRKVLPVSQLKREANKRRRNGPDRLDAGDKIAGNLRYAADSAPLPDGDLECR
jgi:hypothetical protein